MKFLLIVGIVLVIYMVWRHGRRVKGPGESAQTPPQQPPAPQDMISCPICTVHLPRGDAVRGGDGLLYCSQEHRIKGES